MRRSLLLSLTVFLLLCLPGYAQITQSLENADTLSVGSRFQLIIKAKEPVQKISVPDSLDGFTIIKEDIVRKRGAVPYGKLTIAPMKPGSLSFPPLKVFAGGNEYSTDAFRIKVLAVRAEKDSLLRDIKPLKRYPLQIPLWVYALILILLLIWFGIALALYLRRKRREQAATGSPKEIPLPLADWEIALEELKKLREWFALHPEEIRDFHFHLALILRVFLERRYAIPAVEMTSYEIRDAFRERMHPRIQEIMEFFRHCDRVKFAKHQPDQSAVEANVNWLEEYLLAHKPVVEPMAAPSGEGDVSGS